MSACPERELDEAVRAARDAVAAGAWCDLAPCDRKSILLGFDDAIEAEREELALLETLDMGKPISDSLDVDMTAVVHCLR